MVFSFNDPQAVVRTPRPRTLLRRAPERAPAVTIVAVEGLPNFLERQLRMRERPLRTSRMSIGRPQLAARLPRGDCSRQDYQGLSCMRPILSRRDPGADPYPLRQRASARKRMPSTRAGRDTSRDDENQRHALSLA